MACDETRNERKLLDAADPRGCRILEQIPYMTLKLYWNCASSWL
jgi:hypothetical protein